MTPDELEAVIETARINLVERLDLSNSQITTLPDSISNLTHLTILNLDNNQLSQLPIDIGKLVNLDTLSLSCNQITSLPESIGGLHLLTCLNAMENQLNRLPESIGTLTKLDTLVLDYNQLTELPESIGTLSQLTTLLLDYNQISSLPGSIGNLTKLNYLYLENNQLKILPQGINGLTSLTSLDLDKNPLIDLSILQELPRLETIYLFSINLPRRYWSKFRDWKPEWLLDEDNIEIRSKLVQQIGYDKICKELNAREISIWREYSLLRIDRVEAVYGENTEEIIDREPMLLLKMTCPSTNHIHILRVPPDMTSAEEAITWVNHGIHPDGFAIET